ncbi:alpha/beta hydrolase [Galbibacter sp. EGI 63066]|uniref:alpha/beta fold hydrolase n=1 Tax=Galbibacter sp. EGI 63066 TaxID=2993559 RepID=UPI002248B291|nr:alpha/beta hydrolase [Galbibacter sp. EGI 63066]MCX2678673.1 alpha/beta hydrolase [Galbibacter sp. EGI 63066]
MEKSIEKGKIDVGDARLYYEIVGSGEPVILLHGYPLDNRMWDVQFKKLSDKYQTIRYDLRGYGKSDMPVEEGHYLHAEDLKALMDSLKIDKAHLVGLSLGAFVATDFMALYPERLFSVTVTGGAIYEVPGPNVLLSSGEIAERRKKIVEINHKGLDTYKKEWLSYLLKNTGSQGKQIESDLKEMISDWSGWQVRHIGPKLLLGSSVKKKLMDKQPEVPLLILMGMADCKESQNSMLELANLFSSVNITYLNDAGHISNMEQPESFNKALLLFLEKNSQNRNN